jgi:integrase
MSTPLNNVHILAFRTQRTRRPVESFLKRDDEMARRRGQRKGHLRVHNGSWLLTYRVYDQSGVGHRETVTIGPGDGPGRLTEKQAERFAWDHYLSKVDQFSQQPRSLMSIGEFWEKHFKPGASLRLKKTTREQYFSLYKTWIEPRLAKKRLATLDPGDVEMVIAHAIECGKSTATAKHIRKVVSAIFTKAKKLKIASGDNPATLADTPEVMAVRPKLALSAKQMHAVLEALEEPVRSLALTAVITSMNISELCGLQWKHVNLTPEWSILDGEGLKPFTISVRQHFSRGEYGSLKTSSRKRDIPIPPALVAVLATLKNRPRFSGPDDTVFSGGTGQPISENNTRKRKLAPIAKALGITRLSWHVFRYSHATFTEASGMPAHDRQSLMGHGAMDQTDRYTMEDQERVRGGLESIALMILKPQGKVH